MSDASAIFAELLERMTSAICAGNAQVAAECFTPDGIYQDGFYGEFTGREAIADMITGRFHRDASDFVWRVSDACSNGRIGYAHYHFTYVSKIPGSEGRRAGFTGISCCALERGHIRHYSELFERAPVLVQLGFGEERILKSIKRWAK